MRWGTVYMVNKTHDAETWSTCFVDLSFLLYEHHGQGHSLGRRHFGRVSALDKGRNALRIFLG